MTAKEFIDSIDHTGWRTVCINGKECLRKRDTTNEYGFWAETWFTLRAEDNGDLNYTVYTFIPRYSSKKHKGSCTSVILKYEALGKRGFSEITKLMDKVFRRTRSNFDADVILDKKVKNN